MADPKRSAGSKSASRGGKKRNPWLRALIWFVSIMLSLGVVAVGAIAVAYSMVKLPDPNSDFQTNTSFVYYNDGKSRIGSFQVQNRQSIDYDKIPEDVKNAIVAAENRTFWTDPGISVTGLFRATLGLVGLAPADATATGGGSTITQQYIKVMYLTQDKTFTRKAKEILLAAKIGREVSKEQILGGYLNTVYFGRGTYGIEAASQAFFKIPSSKLGLAQSVALAAIVNSPGNLDPAAGKQEAADLLERYQYTLNSMVDMGQITSSQRSEIYNKLPKFPKITNDSRKGGPKGFLLSMVEKELLANGFTEEQVNGGGLKVVTTFDADAQDAAVASAQKNTLAAAAGDKKAARKLHAGLASIDNATGGIVALYGGPDFLKSQWNWANNPRPTGSTFKTYALAAALRNGWTLNDRLNGNSFTPRGDSAPVRNAGGNSGSVTLQNATTHSINSAYVDLVTQIPDGPTQVQTAAEDAGLPDSGQWDLSNRIPLGNTEVSPVNHANAYATFANGGVRHKPHVIAEVFDDVGESVFKADTKGQQTIEEDVATDVSYALTKVTQDGTGYRASQLGYPVAGKTGTVGYGVEKKVGNSTTIVRETRAVWFVGFTKQITTAVVYVKGDEGTGDLGRGFYGSGFPLSTWLDYMKTAMDGKEQLSFDQPTHRVSNQKPTARPKPKPKPSVTPTVEVTPTVTAPPPTAPATTAPPSTAPPATAPPSATGTATAP